MQDSSLVHSVEFKGKGTEYFGIKLPNWILTIVTLGLYYPWAKAEALRYLYQKTEFAGSRFTFHGTGKEMFKGFIKAIAIFLVVYGIFLGCVISGSEPLLIFGMVFLYASILLLVPVAIYGSVRYRMSRTSWRGIHFRYTGELKKLFTTFILGAIFSALTLGLYSFWLRVNMQREVIGNISLGNIRLRFEGEGDELLLIHFKGIFLSIITLGIYTFWFIRDLHQFQVNNILLEQNGQYAKLESNVTGSGFFKLHVVNFLIIVCSLGICAPFATIRTLRYILNTTEVLGPLDLDNLEQAEQDLIDATLEDVSDLLDLDLA